MFGDKSFLTNALTTIDTSCRLVDEMGLTVLAFS